MQIPKRNEIHHASLRVTFLHLSCAVQFILGRCFVAESEWDPTEIQRERWSVKGAASLLIQKKRNKRLHKKGTNTNSEKCNRQMTAKRSPRYDFDRLWSWTCHEKNNETDKTLARQSDWAVSLVAASRDLIIKNWFVPIRRAVSQTVWRNPRIQTVKST
jgi:hypothetical protein